MRQPRRMLYLCVHMQVQVRIHELDTHSFRLGTEKGARNLGKSKHLLSLDMYACSSFNNSYPEQALTVALASHWFATQRKL